MLDPALLKILCCPETHQKLHLADDVLVQQLNARIASGTLKTRSGKIISEPVEGGLLREDGKSLYPIRSGIPVMMVNESIPLETTKSPDGTSQF